MGQTLATRIGLSSEVSTWPGVRLAVPSACAHRAVLAHGRPGEPALDAARPNGSGSALAEEVTRLVPAEVVGPVGGGAAVDGVAHGGVGAGVEQCADRVEVAAL